MKDKLLVRNDVMKMLNCKERKFYDIVNLDGFPKPFRINGLATHQWSENEITIWIDKQKKENRINKVYKKKEDCFSKKTA